MCACSICCRKVSERLLDEGAPMASPSVWTCVCCLEEKKLYLVMRHFMVGGDGFRVVYLQMEFEGMRNLLCFRVF